MLASHGSTGKMIAMNMPAVRDELAATLQETLRLQQRLVDDVRDEAVPVAHLVAQVSVLERLDDRRDQLISQLRRTASAGMRPARTSPPVREDPPGDPRRLPLAAKRRIPRGIPAGQVPAASRQPRVRAAAPRRAESLGPGTRRPGSLHRPGTETGRVRESSLDHPVRLGPRAPHRRDAADRTPVRPVQDLRPGRAARIGRSRLSRPSHARRCAAGEVRARHPRHRATTGIRLRQGVQGMAGTRPRTRRHRHRGDPPGGRARPQADRPPAC